MSLRRAQAYDCLGTRPFGVFPSVFLALKRIDRNSRTHMDPMKLQAHIGSFETPYFL